MHVDMKQNLNEILFQPTKKGASDRNPKRLCFMSCSILENSDLSIPQFQKNPEGKRTP